MNNIEKYNLEVEKTIQCISGFQLLWRRVAIISTITLTLTTAVTLNVPVLRSYGFIGLLGMAFNIVLYVFYKHNLR